MAQPLLIHNLSYLLVVLVMMLMTRTQLMRVEALAPQAKDNCKSTCGEVEIPFPFGIAEGCFLNSWFQVDCRVDNRSTAADGYDPTETPFLRTLNVEIFKISVEDSKLRVRSPIMTWNCGDTVNKSEAQINLDGSPFFYSQTANSLTVLGSCNTPVEMKDQDNKSTWCTPDCDKPPSGDYGDGSPSTNSCSGSDLDCCQSPLPPNLQHFSLGLGSIADANKTDCTLAFLNLPVVLDWDLYNVTAASLGIHEDSMVSCGMKTRITHVNGSFYKNLSLQCICRGGYGNPYLPDGCEDYCSANPYSCTGGYSNQTKTEAVTIVVSTGMGASLLVIVAFWLYKALKKRFQMRQKEIFFKRNVFNSKELEKATDHYNEVRILGQGGQGTVYKGMLSDGTIVAVKKSTIVDEGKVEQFINEVVILSQINHRNIVKLLGCCLETEVPLLVYEFVPNGTLYQHIQNPNEDFHLTWEIRLRIAIEAAGALSYLHYATSMPIYHRDIKSTNILLDEKYRAKVADFGTSKSITIDQTHLTTIVKGTFGYIDPEYFRSSQFTEKSDVYSFGVVIVELLTRKKPIFSDEFQEIRSLTAGFIQAMEENNLLDFLDPQIINEGHIEKIAMVANLAKRCLHLNGRSRPTMKEVAIELERIKMSYENSISAQNYEVVEDSRMYDSTEDGDITSTSVSPTSSLDV
ncbi:Non-specific serine/threonine protein kinase [Bertholletia excelsa]